ncbi:unnamed protein product [Gongylonema pulchrum]|uniref:DUF775 domain-containing protein n=1 Tax=Gongylonema pulchrum TaxID=637853 RepID=A0A183DUC8_9BILA|nr:unnamed protein product [Gongylonema pulchrum]
MQADFVQASETEFVTEIRDAGLINHVVVFLTGISPFPDGTGGAVYIRWPQLGVETNWHYLGSISNNKPSAIFRVAQLHKMDAAHGGLFSSMRTQAMNAADSAQIGISVESLTILNNKEPAVGTTPSQQSSFMEYAEKMVKSFVNYVNSFAVRLPRPENPTFVTDYIPASAVQNWCTNFAQRLQQNPDFWRTIT